MRCLVVGGDGMIGSALARHLQKLNQEVWSTTRRTPTKRRPFVDLLQPDWPSLPAEIDVVFFCAGLPPAACEADPDGARRVMVDAPCVLANRYPHLVKLSSNAVFNGEIPHAREDEGHSPISTYGSLHSEADRLLMDRAAIVRIAKIVGPNSPQCLGQWIRDLEGGKDIEPFTDMVFAPTTLPYLTQALAMIGTDRTRGVFQISGAMDYTYAGFAALLAAKLGKSAAVRPKASERPQPRHSTLDMSDTIERFGIKPQSLRAVIPYVLKNAH